MSTPHSFLRRAVVALGSGLVLVAALAAPASADVPEGWSNPDEMSWLALLGIVLGLPILIALVISAIVMVPSLLRGEGFRVDTESVTWVGGPSSGTAELAEGGKHADSGGASARF
ncbi:hypothetical protein [Nocardioides insulae]|uniref:hypothetical protein n=1 Tax=Nocardioides insulae TaxID=394734 RepID=UPI00049130AF|nr:hypothetical protein [Nocardioides insulae]